ncbi:carboxypeptidase A5-like [Lingula anatina]|uniref:Carboxypeptidase A5-like n=1 Tax=Lingula anatina TaxID=7574 RepID=A0A1S3JAR5_LINAN|nr:carboxypeptidase A5-like [Lingula anatina]XP_013407493.1 carboxypeptidase A5-like [Lingula anatina]XP_013407494.1 carboxypeptidase A5-like [Lingula anatina]XP_013407495.1 carboxypeptidase A5-like [Lingula anatina]|eukprot:XP_013407492.1 carboxypeptidase A5-like [Lingula anatina]
MLLALALTGFCALVTALPTPVTRYDGHKVIRMVAKTQEELEKIRSFIHAEEERGLDVWANPKGVGGFADIRLPAHQVESTLKKLSDDGLKHKTLIDDLQK